MTLLNGTKVLITGGNGFIGSYLTHELVKNGAKVALIVQPKSDLRRINDLTSRLKIFEADVRDYSGLLEAAKKISPKKIFHLAAYEDRSFENASLSLEINVQGTVNLLRALDGIDYDCFINTGTCEEYGNGCFPFMENQPTIPTSPYPASKSAAVMFCEMYYKFHNRPIVTLRLSPTYGPAQGANKFIPNLIVSALKKIDFKMSEGKQNRGFVYITDTIDGYIKASTNPKAIGEIINLGAEEEYSIKEIAEKIVKIMGNPINILAGNLPNRAEEIWHLYCSGRKAAEILGWKPKYGIDEGLKETISWYKEHFKELQ